MDFYYCVKIRTLGFSTCDGFGGGEEFFVFFLFFLPGILYKGRKTSEMNLCLFCGLLVSCFFCSVC